MNNWKKHIANFVVGGCLIVMISILIEQYDVKLASIYWALPYTLFPAIIMMWMENYDNKKIALLGWNGGFSLFLVFVYLMAFYFSMRYFEKNKYGIFYSLAFALIVWSIFAYLFYILF